MGTTKSEAMRQQEFVAAAEAMYVRLRAWRAAHLDASFDEVGDQVTQERQRLMAVLLGELAVQPEEVLVAAEQCRQCGKELAPKGKQVRGVSHLEGEVRVAREYHYCDECQSGLFPPRPPIETDSAYVEPAHD
jgi:hypothetical protein